MRANADTQRQDNVNFTVAHASVNADCTSKEASRMASEEPFHIFTPVIQVHICINQL